VLTLSSSLLELNKLIGQGYYPMNQKVVIEAIIDDPNCTTFVN
jgi:hypothetical protein